MRIRLIAAATALFLSALLPGTPAAAESNGGVKVMPLGDSITDGTQVPGGYRIGLWQRLSAGGYRVDFTGSQYNGPAALGDHDHEGHPGWRIDQIDANVVGWLRNTGSHTVLLHIGTNDILQNHDTGSAPARLSGLIDHITATAPDAEVFVATIIPLADPGQESAARTFNSAVPGIVQSNRNAGKHVHLVDMHAALTTGDLIDGVHPTATGYDKMAATWFGALRSVPGSIGSAGTSTAQQIVGTQSGRCVDAASAADGTQVRLQDCGGQAGQAWTRTGQELTVGGTKCLDASGHGTANGTPVIVWDCHGQANQQWTITANGTITGVQSGLCLDAYGQGTANGTQLVLWACGGQANQQWTLR
ncbi:GDSL-like Lipase/Acylhydrolase family protein [Amycolatopsis pretoriensis]|uniref:GDSL-like Lipase/Acylhydrolase family protein n=1 Tax=Amycolatopsis pretoriensis TaxID=218821 RepID=A0A1H5RIP7_9PSEU|nr:ricin-type beta-trefoil lectin domain protein [Amycolatopsis pretoriensis]SEF37598.1 GDSL-like Lipase/Acylhydrolase family protein [Amycolatopsis pretoriensis]